MKDILIRNKPIFLIGLLTVGVFIGIIFMAQKNSPAGPGLIQIEEAELISENTPTIGLENSKVKLVEFSDFECPACGLYYPYIKELLKNYGDKFLFAYRHFPLPYHSNSTNAAYASLAAANQGKFWEYSDKLYTNQNQLEEEDLFKYAEELELDMEKFRNDYSSPETKSKVNEDIQLAKKLKLNATPSFILNDKFLNVRSPQELEKALRDELISKGYTISMNVPDSMNIKEKKTLLTDNQESDPNNEVGQIFPETGENLNNKSLFGNEKNTEQTNQNIINPISNVEGAESRPEEDEIEKETLIDVENNAYTIKYNQDGFTPKQVSARTGGKVTWKNETNTDIQIEDVNGRYDEFNNPFTVKAGESFTFELYKDKIFTYRETTTQQMGIIFVL